MKINELQLRKMIKLLVKESLLLEYEQIILRKGDRLFIVDDEGNSKYYDDWSEYGDYAHLKPGESEVYQSGGDQGSYGAAWGRQKIKRW